MAFTPPMVSTLSAVVPLSLSISETHATTCIIQSNISRFYTYDTRVELLASGDGLLRCGGEVGREDCTGDAFLFWSACETVGHHSHRAQRLAFDGCCRQRSGMGGDMDKRYDFSDHERARDARLRKIRELYRGYEVNLHRGWLEHRRDISEELVS